MQENSKMRGLTPHLMIVDEVADIDAVESSGESALSETEFLEQMAEFTDVDFEAVTDAFNNMSRAFVESRIAVGKAAASMIGLVEVAETQPQFSKNQPALHKKAVEKRRKRKRGGHK